MTVLFGKNFVARTALGLTLCTLTATASAEPPAASAADPAGLGAPAADAAHAAEPAAVIAAPVDGGLTAEQVAERAVRTSHGQRAREHEREAASAALDQSHAAFIPRLTSTARITRLSKVEPAELGSVVVAPGATSPGPLPADAQLASARLSVPSLRNQYSFESALEVPLSDYLLRLPQLAAVAAHNERAAAWLARASQLQVAVDAKVTYYDWVRATLQAEVADRALAQALAHQKDVMTAQTSGVASKADVLRVRAQVASAELQQTRARSAASLYQQRLRSVMHDPGRASYTIGEDLRDMPARRSRTVDEAALIEQALARRFEARALRESSDAARNQASAALAAGLPRLSAVGATSYAQPNQRVFPPKAEFVGTWEVGLRLTFSPSEIPGARAARAAALFHAQQLDEERAQLQDDIALDVQHQLLALQQSEAAAASTERGFAAAEESYRVRRMLFQNGRATSVELTDAETEWARAQLDMIDARIDLRVAQVKLAHALGEDSDVAATNGPRA